MKRSWFYHVLVILACGCLFFYDIGLDAGSPDQCITVQITVSQCSVPLRRSYIRQSRQLIDRINHCIVKRNAERWIRCFCEGIRKEVEGGVGISREGGYSKRASICVLSAVRRTHLSFLLLSLISKAAFKQQIVLIFLRVTHTRLKALFSVFKRSIQIKKRHAYINANKNIRHKQSTAHTCQHASVWRSVEACHSSQQYSLLPIETDSVAFSLSPSVFIPIIPFIQLPIA